MKPYFVRLAIRAARERPMLGGGYGARPRKATPHQRHKERQCGIATGDAISNPGFQLSLE
jgi:hypothetical protein